MNDGLSQSLLNTGLSFVRNGKHPERDIENLNEKIKCAIQVAKEIRCYQMKKVEKLNPKDAFFNRYHDMPSICFSSFTKEDKMRLNFSSFIMMHPTFVEDDLKLIPDYEVVDKIANSQWRYGFGQDWNTIVSAYNGLKRFSFGDGFDVKLTMSNGRNPYGYSRYEEVYLDGTLGFLIYYKSKHVLTIGFSVSDRKRILIQQVQLKNKKGNRFLYKLPCNVLEYSIQRMSEAFQDMNLYICQADDQIKKIRDSYVYDTEHGEEFLQNDAPRLKAFYSQPLQRFIRHPSKTKFHGVRFRKLVKKT